jgi:hypothetical protein
MILLIPGILAMFGCVAITLENILAYVRHLDSGDQAGFALGNLFLTVWFLPVTAILLLGGAILFRPRVPPEGSRFGRSITIALIAGAGFFVLYGLWEAFLAWPSRGPGEGSMYGGWQTALILSFAVNVLACAIAVRPRPASANGGRRLSLGLILVVSLIVVVPLVAAVLGAIRGKPIQIGRILFMFWPIFAWGATLLWSAWLLRQGMQGARVGAAT